MIPSNLDVIKKLQAQADRNIARGDWGNDFGLPDSMMPESPQPDKVIELLHKVGDIVLRKK